MSDVVPGGNEEVGWLEGGQGGVHFQYVSSRPSQEDEIFGLSVSDLPRPYPSRVHVAPEWCEHGSGRERE